MNAIKQIIAISMLTFSVALPMSSFAESAMDHKMDMSQPASLTDGEVKKVDPSTGKITIKHGDIVHLDMPGMTMVFTAKNKDMLKNVKAGDKIRFMVVDEGGKLVITDIQPGQ
ncbi:MAG: copper-binding protein [Gammaproteobacteria bacterium]|nr:copper-binding protein [Gammaproteobacteria bacterium]